MMVMVAGKAKTMQEVLNVSDLRVTRQRSGAVATDLVRDVSFRVGAGEIVCMVGESGSGKSLSAQAIIGLLSDEPHLTVSGRVEFLGRELLGMDPREQLDLRGSKVTMVFQEPMSSLDPVMRVGNQVAEAVRRVERTSRKTQRARVLELFRQVGLPDPERVFRSYPHELSGGMCQRVMIAMALAPRPALVVADEPTTALDVTVQAQILDLLVKLRDEQGLSILLITHDMGVASVVADRVVVVYAGRTVEQQKAGGLFTNPRHPYTQGLLESLPRMADSSNKHLRLTAIPGMVPEPGNLPVGCAFQTRCPQVMDRCRQEDPPLVDSASGAQVACWVASDEA